MTWWQLLLVLALIGVGAFLWFRFLMWLFPKDPKL